MERQTLWMTLIVHRTADHAHWRYSKLKDVCTERCNLQYSHFLIKAYSPDIICLPCLVNWPFDESVQMRHRLHSLNLVPCLVARYTWQEFRVWLTGFSYERSSLVSRSGGGHKWTVRQLPKIISIQNVDENISTVFGKSSPQRMNRSGMGELPKKKVLRICRMRFESWMQYPLYHFIMDNCSQKSQSILFRIKKVSSLVENCDKKFILNCERLCRIGMEAQNLQPFELLWTWMHTPRWWRFDGKVATHLNHAINPNRIQDGRTTVMWSFNYHLQEKKDNHIGLADYSSDRT